MSPGPDGQNLPVSSTDPSLVDLIPFVDRTKPNFGLSPIKVATLLVGALAGFFIATAIVVALFVVLHRA